jgi:uncharacterized membrane-anchored protein
MVSEGCRVKVETKGNEGSSAGDEAFGNNRNRGKVRMGGQSYYEQDGRGPSLSQIRIETYS